MSFSWRYAAEAVFFIGVAYALVRWIGRALRDTSSGASERETKFFAQAMEGRDVPAGLVSSGASAVPLPNVGRLSTVSLIVHCPACGMALTPVPQTLPFVADCESCARRVRVRGDGPGRMSVVVDERRQGGREAERQ